MLTHFLRNQMKMKAVFLKTEVCLVTNRLYGYYVPLPENFLYVHGITIWFITI